MNYEIKKIAGIDCIFAPMMDANSITVEIMVKAGSFYETRETNGISHFLEHMFFKGGKKYPTPSIVAQSIENFGGEFNAYTGGGHAGYYVKCAPEFATKALDVLSDMLVDAQFPAAELEREKDVVIQEIKMYSDDPQSVAEDKWSERYVGDNSYGWTTLGPEENIRSFTQKHLFDHKNSLYTKDNLIIVVAGNIKEQEVLEELISQLFLSLPEKKTYVLPPYSRHLPGEKLAHFHKETQQSHLIISAPGFKGTDDKRYAAKLLTTILGGNMSSRLFQNVREKYGLCYYIGASHHSYSYDGTFYIRAGIDKDRFDFGVEKINDEINRIAQGDISQEEFDNAKGFRIGSLQMGIETTDSLAGFLGNHYLIYGHIETLQDVIDAYQQTTIEQVKAVASSLASDNRFMYYLD